MDNPGAGFHGKLHSFDKRTGSTQVERRTLMPPTAAAYAEELNDVIAYLAATGELMNQCCCWRPLCPLIGQVTHERILKSASEPGNWLHLLGYYPPPVLAALTNHEGNVAQLKPAWVYQTNSLQKFETTRWWWTA